MSNTVITSITSPLKTLFSTAKKADDLISTTSVNLGKIVLGNSDYRKPKKGTNHDQVNFGDIQKNIEGLPFYTESTFRRVKTQINKMLEAVQCEYSTMEEIEELAKDKGYNKFNEALDNLDPSKEDPTEAPQTFLNEEEIAEKVKKSILKMAHENTNLSLVQDLLYNKMSVTIKGIEDIKKAS
tara:strand:+ start:49 stop:597 length:549 start_codon:yes stop_codon:yes gene_type:complete